jgi:ATP-dependent DNA ligase
MAPVVERRKKIQFSKGNVYVGKPFNELRWVEDKLDGLRGGIIFKGNVGTAVTLTGLPIPNAQHIVDELAASGQFDDQMIDGEFKGRDWNESQSIVKKQSPHPDALNLKFHVFDTMPTTVWETQKGSAPLCARKESLKKRVTGSILPHVVYVEHRPIFSDMQVIPARNEANARGLEGIMIKVPDALYAFRKNNDWLKCKPINEDDFVITGATEGRGKNEKMLGALAITAPINGQIIVSEVGTGFDDMMRKRLWADFLNGRLLGRLVQVEYQEITEDNSLRFPAFMRMRDDKNA